jgi:transglutaminase-like putative cysteine protease
MRSTLPALVVGLVLLFSSCNKKNEHGVPMGATGLQPGLNYMQPNKWEMSYRYRVKHIKPTFPIRDTKPSIWDPITPVVGKGTFEVWVTGPIESDDVRKVTLLSVKPEPSRTEYSEEDGKTWLYYDIAPDDRLPADFMIDVTWSFYTFERYVFWDGLDVSQPYDKSTEFYKKFTREEYPIEFHAGIVKDAKSCVDPNDPDNVFKTTLNIYNKIVMDYTYDYKHMYQVPYGEDGLIPTSRVWLNKRGVCDEFGNIFTAMARSVGIPSRPCCGFAHIPLDEQMKNMSDEDKQLFKEMNVNINENIGPPMGHAWAEFYIEGVGWVPVDATWGKTPEVISADVSPMANRRNISYVDYYFGKMDPYRITMFKSWNYELLPNPRTPKANKTEPWMSLPTARYSGVTDMVHGFDMTHDNPAFAAMSEYSGNEVQSRLMWDMKNARPKIVHIATPPKAEVDELIKQIESEGSHFVQVPTYKWEHERQETTYISW